MSLFKKKENIESQEEIEDFIFIKEKRISYKKVKRQNFISQLCF